MAIKNIIAAGIGFSPGSTKFIPTLGFGFAAAVAITITLPDATWDGKGSIPSVLVKEVGGSSNTVAVTAPIVDSVQQTIDGSSTLNIAKAYGWSLFLSDKTNWMAFANPDTTEIRDVTTITADTILAVGNDVVLVDASSGNITITLLASASKTGKTMDIKKIDSSANIVTLDANALELIDGGLTAVLTDQYESITIFSDGSEQRIL